MRGALALLALAGSAAAQAVTGLIVPSSTPPAGCDNSRQGTFDLTIVSANHTTRRARDLLPRQDGDLHLSLTGGKLTDGFGRTGYIASNYQFQFDKPPQAGAIYTAGWTICPNGSLALGGQAVFWQCLSGSFYNLYDRDWAVHCGPVYFQAVQGAGQAYSTTPPGPVSTGPDQATIANGGGTQSMNMTATAAASGLNVGAPTTTTAGGSASGASTTPTTTRSAGAAVAAIATAGPQAVLAWALGVAGALVMV